jgi:nicotinamidase-related amidase
MSLALVLIDLQNDHFPGGAMELAGAEDAAAQAAEPHRALQRSGAVVVHVLHVAMRPGATFSLPGTHGAEDHPAVRPEGDEVRVIEHRPNGFRDQPAQCAALSGRARAGDRRHDDPHVHRCDRARRRRP